MHGTSTHVMTQFLYPHRTQYIPEHNTWIWNPRYSCHHLHPSIVVLSFYPSSSPPKTILEKLHKLSYSTAVIFIYTQVSQFIFCIQVAFIVLITDTEIWYREKWTIYMSIPTVTFKQIGVMYVCKLTYTYHYKYWQGWQASTPTLMRRILLLKLLMETTMSSDPWGVSVSSCLSNTNYRVTI